ncbi:hypothetical protein GV64_09080 [Endozoicomonas elysicola]|uniref:Uncharacterized protein n=2 Tax=Endozoicomonas elysicola TaxID=305900 RepID=A0A081K9Q0_9GAMM|nr:hypothetical protein GV64_09080 [Endozoicomonas elysicola]
MLSALSQKKVVCSIAFLCSLVVSSVFADHHDVVPFQQKGGMTLSDRFEALQKIRLAERSSDGTEELFLVQGPDYTKRLFVDSGSFVAVSQHVDQQATEDVINSTLFAQLAASHDYDKNTQLVQWYGRYTDVMSIQGWDISDFDESSLSSASTDLSVSEVIFDILKAALKDPSEQAMVNAAVGALKQLEKEGAFISLFNHSAIGANRANFQSSFVTRDKHGLVSMNLGYLVVGFKDISSTILFLRVKEGESWIKSHSETVKLDYDVFNQIRDQIIEKLGDNARSQVAGIDL